MTGSWREWTRPRHPCVLRLCSNPLSSVLNNWPTDQGAELVEHAAVLAIGISQNQPFLNGNKRTAYAAPFTFLEMNGHSLNAESLDIATQLARVAERSGELDAATNDFAAWLRDRLTLLDK